MTDTTERSPEFLELQAGLHAESIDWVLARLGKVTTVAEVTALHRLEVKHPNFDGGRKGVLDALEERKGEIKLEAKESPISHGTARGPRPAGPDDAAATTAPLSAEERAAAATAGAAGEGDQLPDAELEEGDARLPVRPDTEPTTGGEDLEETPDDAEKSGGTRPTVGRQVHYVADEDGPVMAATVVRVHSAVLVDLIVLIPRAHNPATFVEAVKYDEDGQSQSWHWPERD